MGSIMMGMAAAAAQIAEAGLRTAKGESISNGVWTLVGVIVTAAFTALGIWLRQGPVWKKTEQDGDTQLRSEMWKDIEKLKQAKEDQSRRLTMAEAKIAGQTVRLGQQAFVITMLLDEIERLSPGNTIARSARALINMQADQMPNAEEIAPMAEVMAKMCKVPDAGQGE